MGRRGPPPMPAALRKMRGRRHRKRDTTPAPEPPVGAPEMPDVVRADKIARHAWTRLCKDLTEVQVLSPQHWAALSVLCLAYSMAHEATERIQRDGLLLKSSRGKLYTHPAYKVQQQAWAQILRASQEFGLTPSAATRVRAFPRDAQQQDKAKESAEAFLFGGKVVGSIGNTSNGARVRE